MMRVGMMRKPLLTTIAHHHQGVVINATTEAINFLVQGVYGTARLLCVTLLGKGETVPLTKHSST